MGYSVKLPDIDFKFTVDFSKINVDKSKIEAAAEEAGEIYNDKFNETVSENTAPPVPTILTGNFDTKQELADRLSFYGSMRKVFKEAEDDYISLQKAILGGDNKKEGKKKKGKEKERENEHPVSL